MLLNMRDLRHFLKSKKKICFLCDYSHILYVYKHTGISNGNVVSQRKFLSKDERTKENEPTLIR